MLKPCSRHSEDLRKELQRKGLWKFVRPERAREAMKEWLAGTTTPDTWDPYVGCVAEIFGQIAKMRLNVHPLDGGKEECPLCTVNVRLMNAHADRSWIDNVTDALYVQGLTNGLVKPS